MANRDAGEWIDANLPADAVLASWDAGVVGYYARRPVINLDGVANSVEYYDAGRERDGRRVPRRPRVDRHRQPRDARSTAVIRRSTGSSAAPVGRRDRGGGDRDEVLAVPVQRQHGRRVPDGARADRCWRCSCTRSDPAGAPQALTGAGPRSTRLRTHRPRLAPIRSAARTFGIIRAAGRPGSCHTSATMAPTRNHRRALTRLSRDGSTDVAPLGAVHRLRPRVLPSTPRRSAAPVRSPSRRQGGRPGRSARSRGRAACAPGAKASDR